jgi:hypothetical protein
MASQARGELHCHGTLRNDALTLSRHRVPAVGAEIRR